MRPSPRATSLRRELLSRRRAIATMLGAGLGASSLLAGCVARPDAPLVQPTLPTETPEAPPSALRFTDNVDALCDVILPAELDAAGTLVSPGAREAKVDAVLRIQSFVALAVAQGLLPPLQDAIVASLSDLSGPVRATMNADLDALAAKQRPLTTFRELTRDLQEAVVRDAFADDLHKSAFLAVRAACFTAYLGAVASDVGLREVGFPPFEDLGDGLAVSGYPRTRAGRLIDAAKEDLAALAAAGDLDDYTWNRAPMPTAGDDLSLVIDANGDLL